MPNGSVFNINKSVTKNQPQNISNFNQKDKIKKINTKSREIKSSKGIGNIDKSKKRAKKFKDIDEIVLLLQKHVRKYLERIHNDPKLKMIKMLKEKKKNLFENYKITKNPALINEFKKELAEKNKNDENINLNEKDCIEKEPNENIETNIEEPKEINMENNVNKVKKKRKKPMNNFKFEIIMEKRNKLDDNNNKIITENEKDIKDKSNIEIQDSKELNNIINDNSEEKTKENITENNLNNKDILENENSKDWNKYVKNEDEDNQKNDHYLDENKSPKFEENEKIIIDEIEKNEKNLILEDLSINKNENPNKSDRENKNIKDKNNLLQNELNGAKKKLLTMSKVISELKSQLLSKKEFIDKNINNINNKNLDQNINQTNLINLLISEKKSLEEKNSKLEKDLLKQKNKITKICKQ